MTAIDVRLRAVPVERVGYRHDVLLGGEVIIRRSRDPEYDAARVLHARGLGGRFRTVDFRTGRPRMILDIEKAAKLRTIERPDKGPPTVGPYRPMSEEARSLLRGQPSHQGGRVWPEVVPSTGQPTEAAGGETVVARSRARNGVARRRVREDA